LARRRSIVLQRRADALGLTLHVREHLLQPVHPRLHLVQRIVQRLHLAGDGIHLGAFGRLLRRQLLLQRVQVDAQPVHRVRRLLDQVLQHAHPLVVRLLQPGNGILQLLDLRLQLHHVFIRAGEGGRCQGENQDG
jgi:hypothetical protein